MATLTHRAESGLIGALLHKPELMAAMVVGPSHFANEQHARVFQALSEAPERNLAPIAARANVTEHYLAELKDSVPEPSHGTEYQLLVREADILRRIRGATEDMAARATQLRDDATTRPGETRFAAIGRHVRADHLRAEALALQARCEWFNPDKMTGIRRSFPVASKAEDLVERQVLAALIHRHPETDRVLATLAPEQFADTINQEIYRAVFRLHATGYPVDPLTTDWEVSRQLGYGWQGALLSPASHPEPDYITSLASLPVSHPLPAARFLARRGPENDGPHGTRPAEDKRPSVESGPWTPQVEPPPQTPGTGPAGPRPRR